jgi:toxin FitB
MLSVLDTSVLIGNAPTQLEGDLAISAVSVAELHFGVLVAGDDRVRASRLARLSAIQSVFDPLPVDGLVASSYGMLAAATVAAGRKREARSLDVMIAATAHAHHARLVTANAHDVQHLADYLEIVAVTV